MFSFLGCSKRVKICKSDIPVAVPVALPVADPVAVPVAVPELEPVAVPVAVPELEPVDHQDIHVQTIDPTDVLEPVSKLTESMPMILPGQPVMEMPILDAICQQLADDLIDRIINADVQVPEPEVKPEVKPEVTFYRTLTLKPSVKVVEVQKVNPKNTIRALYNHHYWPSPRPVNFVRCLYDRCFIPSIYYNQGKVSKGRLTHMEALNILASCGSMTVDELLQITPVEYLETKFKLVYSQIRTFSALQGVNPCY